MKITQPCKQYNRIIIFKRRENKQQDQNAPMGPWCWTCS